MGKRFTRGSSTFSIRPLGWRSPLFGSEASAVNAVHAARRFAGSGYRTGARPLPQLGDGCARAVLQFSNSSA